MQVTVCSYFRSNGEPPCCTHDCDGCIWREKEESNTDETPKTNRDVINGMDNKQLGEWLENLIGDLPWCCPEKYGTSEPDENGVKRCLKWDCEKCATEWLNEEAK